MNAYRNLFYRIRLALSILSIAIPSVLLIGCGSIGTDYVDPAQAARTELAPDSHWVQPQSGEFVIRRDWWKAMGDAELDRLIEEATGQNIDLKLLAARMTRAELELRGAGNDQWPSFDASIGYSDSRVMNDIRTTGTKTRAYSIGTGLSWEADIWGKLKQRKEAQWAQVQATEADWRAGYLALVGNLTRSYFNVRRLDEQKFLHVSSREHALEAMEKYKLRQQGGLESSERINNQQAEILRLEREIMEIDRQRQTLVNDIAFLLGKAAGQMSLPEVPLRSCVKLIELPREINANLLERRPDIVAAERRVRQAYHLSESARAARMPSLSIGVSTNMTDVAFSALTQNWTASILPSIRFPALDPNTKVRLKLSEVELQEAHELYKRTVLNAIREVENALINLRNHHHQLDLERRRVAELADAREKAKIRLAGGIISQLEIFEIERSFLGASQKGLELYTQLLEDIVVLHNALGGGWE